MAWMAPRTWTDTEIVTAAIMNQDIRDNQLILKVPIDDNGRIRAFDSAYFASLSGANLTNVAFPGQGNIFTDGKTSFEGTSLFKIPVGTDKYDGTSGDKTPGSVWVEGDYLHHVDDNQDEWRYIGDLDSSPGAQAGFLMLSGTNIYYTDEDGDLRKIVSTSTPHNDGSAFASVWVETYMHWIQETNAQEYEGHADISHTDNTNHNDHSDHVDSGPPHADHSDHSDFTNPHQDTHTDHFDSFFEDEHTDHTDHGDTTTHDDVAHTDFDDHNDHSDHNDVAADSRPEFIGAS
jgi:hypothetical protein